MPGSGIRVGGVTVVNPNPIIPRSNVFGVWLRVVLLVLLAIVVKGRHLVPVDLEVALWAEALHTYGLLEAAQTSTFFGSSPWVLGVMALMSLRWRRQPGMIAILWGTWLLGFVTQMLLRFWVAQWRPDTIALPAAADLMTRYHLAGFTSGHAFRSAFLYGWWIGSLERRRGAEAMWARIACILLIGLVGITRIYLDRHWLTDVLGAWILASLALTVAWPVRQRAWQAAQTR